MPATPERTCDRRSRTDHLTQMQEYFFDRGLRIQVGQAWGRLVVALEKSAHRCCGVEGDRMVTGCDTVLI